MTPLVRVFRDFFIHVTDSKRISVYHYWLRYLFDIFTKYSWVSLHILWYKSCILALFEVGIFLKYTPNNMSLGR